MFIIEGRIRTYRAIIFFIAKITFFKYRNHHGQVYVEEDWNSKHLKMVYSTKNKWRLILKRNNFLLCGLFLLILKGKICCSLSVAMGNAFITIVSACLVNFL